MEVELKNQIKLLRSKKTFENRDLINKEIRGIMKKLNDYFKNFIECDICYEIVRTQNNNKCTNKKCDKNYCDVCINRMVDLDKCPYCRCDLSNFDYFNIVMVEFIQIHHNPRREKCVCIYTHTINKKYEIDYNLMTTRDIENFFNDYPNQECLLFRSIFSTL